MNSKAKLHDLLSKADFISLHVPFVPKANENLLDDAEFQAMKKYVRIINTARGGIVNELGFAEKFEK